MVRVWLCNFDRHVDGMERDQNHLEATNLRGEVNMKTKPYKVYLIVRPEDNSGLSTMKLPITVMIPDVEGRDTLEDHLAALNRLSEKLSDTMLR